MDICGNDDMEAMHRKIQHENRVQSSAQYVTEFNKTQLQRTELH